MKLNITYICTKAAEDILNSYKFLEMAVLSVYNEEGFVFQRQIFKTEPTDFKYNGDEKQGFRAVNYIENTGNNNVDFISEEREFNRLYSIDASIKTTNILREFASDELVQILSKKAQNNLTQIQETDLVDTYVSSFTHELDMKDNCPSR